jgi:uracil-DNA glycosylase
MKITLVGEARGETEERFNHGFCGSSGAELIRMLGESQFAPNIEIPYPSALDMS